MYNKFIFFTLTIGIIFGINSHAQTSYSLSTTWGENLDIQDLHNEYPRPILEREEWLNLNGEWEFQESYIGEALPSQKKLREKIIVPFPWESKLSGINRQLTGESAWYRRSFDIPKSWEKKDIILNFGAVDWECHIYINETFVGSHKGGYDPFSFNITPYIKSKGKQSLMIWVNDPTNSKAISYGKQNKTRFSEPKGYTYSPSSGIWQTVWLEPVSNNHINNLVLVPNIDSSSLEIRIDGKLCNKGYYEVSVMDKGDIVSKKVITNNKCHSINIPNIKLWSPNQPFLYSIVVEMKDNQGIVHDRIESYTGMRKISLVDVDGVQKLALNNEVLFQMGPLDQGYWPDGIYTAPCDEAIKWEIENMKEWGFNMVRKHVKVEPSRWYYWCDKLGLIVWQDMPNTFKERTEEDKIQFESELFRMIKSLRNHPSIVNWIVFNEHWGLYDVERLTESVMKLDPSRLVTGNSGIDSRKPSIDYEVGHIKDNHSYRPPHVPLISSKRATVNGEYGAIGYCLRGHIWDIDGPWVHYNYDGSEAATKEYELFISQILEYIKRGLSAAVYTQWTDVENEMNGLFTYDRKKEKLDKKRVKEANRSTYDKYEHTSGQTDSQHIQ